MNVPTHGKWAMQSHCRSAVLTSDSKLVTWPNKTSYGSCLVGDSSVSLPLLRAMPSCMPGTHYVRQQHMQARAIIGCTVLYNAGANAAHAHLLGSSALLHCCGLLRRVLLGACPGPGLSRAAAARSSSNGRPQRWLRCLRLAALADRDKV